MANDMMLAALAKQRDQKMSPQMSPAPGKPDGDEGGLAARIEALEQKYDELCKMMGMEETTGNAGVLEKTGNPGKMEKY